MTIIINLEFLENTRRELGLCKTAFAKYLGISYRTLVKTTTNGGLINYPSARKICFALKIPFKTLCGE